MPADIQRGLHLGERQGRAVPGEGVRGIGRALVVSLLLENGIVGAPLEEVDEGPLQMAQGLLKRHGGDFGEKGILFLEGG